MLGIVFGFLVGSTLGVLLYRYSPLGIKLGAHIPAEKYEYVDSTADHKQDLEPPPHGEQGLSSKVRREARACPKWTVEPGYAPMRWLNTMVQQLWKINCQATTKLMHDIIKQGKADWINMAAAAGVKIVDIELERFELGPYPIKIGGLRCVDTPHDEVLLDIGVQWGSGALVRAGAHIRLPFCPVDLYVPLELRDISISAVCRVTLKPLVNEIPVIGAVNISLMEVPDMDMEVDLADGRDLMSAPGMRIALSAGLEAAVGNLLTYPNSMTFPLLENSGLPPPMQGLLEVTVRRGIKLPSQLTDTIDPIVELEVRNGRTLCTSVKDNDPNPEWDETYRFIVDDIAKQDLTILLKDDDLFSDECIAYQVVPLQDCLALVKPRSVVRYQLDLKPIPSNVSDMATLKIALRRTDRKPTLAARSMSRASKFASGRMDSLAKAGSAVSAKATATFGKTANAVRKTVAFVPKRGGAAGLPNGHSPANGHVVIHEEGSGATAVVDDVTEDQSRNHRLLPHRSNDMKDNQGFRHRVFGRRASHDVSNQSDMEVTVVPSGSAKQKGSLVVDLRWIPLRAASTSAVKEQGYMQRLLSRMDNNARGVLSCTIVACNQLKDGVAPFVVVKLSNDDPDHLEIVQTPVKFNESNPRWDYTSDFVNAPVTSSLFVTVKSRMAPEDSYFSKAVKVAKQLVTRADSTTRLGWTRIPVIDVARNGKLKDVWTLRDAERGSIELQLEWTPIEVDVEGSSSS